MRYTLYSAAASAVCGREVGICALTLLAVSKEEAEGIALNHTREIYPESEGWRQHTASVGEVPMDWIQAAKC